MILHVVHRRWRTAWNSPSPLRLAFGTPTAVPSTALGLCSGNSRCCASSPLLSPTAWDKSWQASLYGAHLGLLTNTTVQSPYFICARSRWGIKYMMWNKSWAWYLQWIAPPLLNYTLITPLYCNSTIARSRPVTHYATSSLAVVTMMRIPEMLFSCPRRKYLNFGINISPSSVHNVGKMQH